MTAADSEAWPPILPTARAAAYCSVSRWVLIRAADAGELVPYGRRGRTLTWRREDLDRWMRGPIATPATVETSREPRAARSTTGNALDRIRRLARGGAR